MIFSYLLLVVIGLWPVNRDFVETRGGIEVFVYSSSVHSDIILPVQTASHDWRDEFQDEHFRSPPGTATHIAIGWGDRGFYIETPTWADLKVSTALRALLLPSETVMHVGYCPQPIPGERLRSVTISPEQYDRLVAYIRTSFERDADGQIQPIPNSAYGQSDAFFVAQRRYHCFRTCNCWTGRALQEAGIKVGWFTPLPRSVFLYLP